MYDPDLSRSDVCSIRAAAEHAKFTEAARTVGGRDVQIYPSAVALMPMGSADGRYPVARGDFRKPTFTARGFLSEHVPLWPHARL